VAPGVLLIGSLMLQLTASNISTLVEQWVCGYCGLRLTSCPGWNDDRCSDSEPVPVMCSLHPACKGRGSAELTVGHIWWPMTQSQITARVDHDYSRIMMSSHLLPSVLCNDMQAGILDMTYSLNIYIV